MIQEDKMKEKSLIKVFCEKNSFFLLEFNF